MRKLLITGFDPFGGQIVNPSWEAVKLLPERIGPFQLRKLQIPTRFGTAAEAVIREAESFRPDTILCIGQAGGRDAVTPERIGINVRSADIPDNGGFRPLEMPVVPDGPDGYFSTVPVVRMAEAIREAHIPGAVSNTAGTFVCNDTLYSLLHHYAGTAVQVGFIHVPYLPEQGSPSLPLEQIAAALRAAIAVC